MHYAAVKTGHQQCEISADYHHDEVLISLASPAFTPQVIADAKERLLAPAATIIPRRAAVFAQPVQASEVRPVETAMEDALHFGMEEVLS